MMPDRSSTSRTSPERPEIEPIGPDEAHAILTTAMQPYLEDGWQVIHESAYIARLTRDMRNVDLRIDLLGKVEVEEKGLTPLQESGRLMAWLVLLAMLLVALALSSALGIF